MRTPHFVAILSLAVALAAGIPLLELQRGRDAPAPAEGQSPASYGEVEQRLLPSAEAEELTATSGRRLSCEEIRGMDEVEWITDDSYCTESS
jgi:hypothetical protein